MIVNLQPNGWEIIYHRAHALLAAQIAGQWEFQDHFHRLYETIAAIAHHDDLEKEWEEDQLTEAGAPLDFTLERETSVAQMRRHTKEALYKGRWVALLISRHQCFLNQGSDDPEIVEFVTQQREQQTQWRKDLGLSKDEVDYAYNFMRWCDRLSLILCQRQVPDSGRQLEVTTGPEDKDYHLYQLDSGAVCITPWPFRAQAFEVAVDACDLSQLQFASNDELTAALTAAPYRAIRWKLACDGN